MTQKRKARPAGSAAEQAKGENHQISRNPRIDFITGRRRISSLLNYGQENAVNRRHLEVITGLDGRTVRLLIERERRGGMPIEERGHITGFAVVRLSHSVLLLQDSRIAI